MQCSPSFSFEEAEESVPLSYATCVHDSSISLRRNNDLPRVRCRYSETGIARVGMMVVLRQMMTNNARVCIPLFAKCVSKWMASLER